MRNGTVEDRDTEIQGNREGTLKERNSTSVPFRWIIATGNGTCRNYPAETCGERKTVLIGQRRTQGWMVTGAILVSKPSGEMGECLGKNYHIFSTLQSGIALTRLEFQFFEDLILHFQATPETGQVIALVLIKGL